MRKAGVAGLVIVASLSAGYGAEQTGRPSTASRSSQAITLPLILAIEDARAPTQADVGVLLEALRTEPLRNAVIRALGRLQRRDLITDLLPFLSLDNARAAGLRGEAAAALAQALRGRPLDGVSVTHGQQEQAVLEAMLAAGAAELSSTRPVGLISLARSLGQLPYERPEQFKAAETFLRLVLERPFPKLEDSPHIGAARGLESLARLNRTIATLDEETISRLRTLARTVNPKRSEQQRNALAALIASQRVDAETLEVVLTASDAEVRRLAVLALAGSGSAIADEERIGFIRRSLSDASFMVRLEAVRAWTRRGVREHGCMPLLDALSDRSFHVVLAALDVLGDQCREDSSITDRVTAEARTPPPQGRWQREAHAFVALAKRDRERASIAMLTFAMHPVWQVRMYAARAAAIVDDVPVLLRLAADPEDNVAEATLIPLRRILGAESDAVFIAVLNRTNRAIFRKVPARPYEIIRTAARALEDARTTPELIATLVRAVERISAEECETSRDTRLALIERLGQHGSEAQASSLIPLLKDIDPVAAAAAAAVLTRWTGKVAEIESPRRLLSNIPTEQDVDPRGRVVFEMESGRTFEVDFSAGQAPLSRTRFLAAVRSGYYDNLTFHRVVPNFVIQGGSPGANEYCGDCPFMRDEVGPMHTRGTIGISTRGPDTGDAQIFINLVDNPRLDYVYTVFARVCRGMDVVDDIQEGDRITRVRIVPPTAFCGG